LLAAFSIVERLYQVIQRIYFISLQSILAESCGEDDPWADAVLAFIQHARQLDAAQVRHLDIQKHQVHRLLMQPSQGFHRTRVAPNQLQERCLFYKGSDHAQSQRLVVDGNAFQCHAKFSFKCTRYSLSGVFSVTERL
jgi:hypothetical protein